MRRDPPDYSKSKDAIEFALSIFNEPKNRMRDTEWFREFGPSAEADFVEIVQGNPPVLQQSTASLALELVLDGNKIRFEYGGHRENQVPKQEGVLEIKLGTGDTATPNSNEMHRLLLANAVLLLWNDERRKKGLFKRCCLEGCGQFYFGKKKTQTSRTFCCDKHRSADDNLDRKTDPGKKKRRQAAKKKYHDPKHGLCQCHGGRGKYKRPKH